MLFVATSCHLLGSSPGVPVCSDRMDIEGDYPHERVREAADDACRIMLHKTDLTDADIDDLPNVTVRVYGPGESTRYCQHARSGTCAAKLPRGYHVDVRQEPHNPDASPAHVDDRITHEMMHVLAYEMGVPGPEQHRWMLRQSVCGDMCTYSHPLD
jgi:hypothetical protein